MSIRERARLIGADVQITSAPESGTKIQLRVPLMAAPATEGHRVVAPASAEAERSEIHRVQPRS